MVKVLEFYRSLFFILLPSKEKEKYAEKFHLEESVNALKEFNARRKLKVYTIKDNRQLHCNVFHTVNYIFSLAYAKKTFNKKIIVFRFCCRVRF